LDEAGAAMSAGEAAWLVDDQAKQAVNQTLHRMGFSRQYEEGVSRWRNGSTVYRVEHQVQGHPELSGRLVRES